MCFSSAAVILVISPHNEAGFLPSRSPEYSGPGAVPQLDAGKKKNTKRELSD